MQYVSIAQNIKVTVSGNDRAIDRSSAGSKKASAVNLKEGSGTAAPNMHIT